MEECSGGWRAWSCPVGTHQGLGGRGGRVGVCGGAAAGRGRGLSLGRGTSASRLGGLKPVSYAAQGSAVDLPEPLERGRGKPQKGSLCRGAVWEVASGVTMLALQEAALDAPAACTSTGVGLHQVSWWVPEQERTGSTSSSEPGQDSGAPEIQGARSGKSAKPATVVLCALVLLPPWMPVAFFSWLQGQKAQSWLRAT